jgi:hypothetical protein
MTKCKCGELKNEHYKTSWGYAYCKKKGCSCIRFKPINELKKLPSMNNDD